MKSKGIIKLAHWLVLIGALNWGFAIWNFNLVDTISTAVNFPTLATVLYALIGLSGLWLSLEKIGIVR